MGARTWLISAASAALLIVACATGGDGGGDTNDGGGPIGNSDAPVAQDAAQDSPMGMGESASGTSSGDDSGMPRMDSGSSFDALAEIYIPPTPESGPSDSGSPGMDVVSIPDTSPPPPMDVVTTTPKCSFGFKHALEVSEAESADSGVPCTAGCTSGQCCAEFASPPICIKN